MIIGIFGNLSSGKTVLAVKLLVDEQHSHPDRKIISNVKLNIPYVHLSNDEIISVTTIEKKASQFYKGLMFIDEMHNLIDARRSSSTLNQAFTQWVTQVGKLDIDLIFTSQLLESQVDLRVRELCDIYNFCFRTRDNLPLVFGQRIEHGEIRINVRMYVKLYGGAKYMHTSYSFDPKPYYAFYNTREIVVLDRDKYLRR